VVRSALGLVNFAGQLLQGCQNIRTVLDAINDATDDLRLFRTELKIFLSLLEEFKTTLAKVDWSVEAERWDLARLALDYSDEAVTEMQSLLDEYDTRKPGRWNDVRFSMRKGKFDKHQGRIEKAKGYILASRTNLSLYAPSQNSIWLCLFTDSFQPISILELKKAGLHQDTEANLRAISALSSKVSATANIVSLVPNQLQEVNNTTLETRGAIENLTRSISNEFAQMPSGINKMIESTLRRLIRDHLLPAPDSSDSCKATLGDTSIHDSTRSGKFPPGHLSSGRQILKQKQNRIVIQTWLGVVFIHSTIVKTQNTVDRQGLTIRLGAAKTTRVNVEVALTPCTLRIGLFCSIIWNKMPENRSGFDVKLRVYNSVDETSEIIQACRTGNMEWVQKLFTAKEASPFDRLGGNQTLLDIILEEMILVPMEQDPEYALKKMENLYLMFKMIVSHGLDPGQPWSHLDSKSFSSPLPFLAQFCFFTPPDVFPVLLNTTRTIIEHSIQDPFSTADFTEVLRFLQCATTRTPHTVTQLILNQEHWQPEWEIKENLRPFQSDKPEKLGPYDAAWFRTWLRHGADIPEVKMAVRQGLQNISNAVIFGGMSEEIADQLCYHHLVVALEFGIDLQDEYGGPSILTLFREFGKLYQMRAAFWYFNWDDDDITELFEADLISSLAFQLAYLEHHRFEGIKLPAELQFKEILCSDWNSYLETLDGCDHKILHPPAGLHSSTLKHRIMSGAQHESSHIQPVNNSPVSLTVALLAFLLLILWCLK